MVYKIMWTPKALESYLQNMQYLSENWSGKEIEKFAYLVEEKLSVLSMQPEIGSIRNLGNKSFRHTVIHKRVSLIYRINPSLKQVELLLFWNTWQHPAKLKIK